MILYYYSGVDIVYRELSVWNGLHFLFWHSLPCLAFPSPQGTD